MEKATPAAIVVNTAADMVQMRIDDERRQIVRHLEIVVASCTEQLKRMQAGEYPATWMDGRLQCTHVAKDADEASQRIKALSEQLALLRHIGREVAK